MKPSNLEYLLSVRTKLKYLVQSQSGNISAEERSNFQRIMSEEFWPGYTTDLWCPSCCFKMCELLHQKFEKWLSDEEKRKEEERIEADRKLLEEHLRRGAELAMSGSPDSTSNGNGIADMIAELDELENKEQEDALAPAIEVAASFPVNDPPVNTCGPVGGEIKSITLTKIEAEGLLREQTFTPPTPTEDVVKVMNNKPRKPKRK